MKPLDLVLKYMKIFFSGRDIKELSPLLAEGLSFEGPFYKFDTAEDYINSLKENPPEYFKYKIIQSFENESYVCLVFQFSKPGLSIPMTQMFEISNDKISKILLIFDTRVFT